MDVGFIRPEARRLPRTRHLVLGLIGSTGALAGSGGRTA
jgi:hypothetical protein